MQIVRIAGHDPGPLTGAGSNTYLIAGKVPTLVDTASGSPRHLDELATALEDSASALDQVLVTHAHPDHAGGAPAVAGRWPATVFRNPRGQTPTSSTPFPGLRFDPTSRFLLETVHSGPCIPRDMRRITSASSMSHPAISSAAISSSTAGRS